MRHEIRLYWRTGRKVGSLWFLGILVALLHLLALGIVLSAGSPGAVAFPPGLFTIWITFGLAFAMILMTSRTLTAAVQALYTRGDMDLLASSPIEPNAIVAVRAVAIALNVTVELGLLLWPFANVFVLFGHFAWLKAYLLLPAVALLATSLALVLMVVLFRVLGPRRTRVFVQVAAAVLGMSFVLLGQLTNVMRRGSTGRGANPFRDWQPRLDEPWWLPGVLVQKGFTPTVGLLFVAAAVLFVTVRSLGHRFIDASTLVAGVDRSGRARARATPFRIRAGLRGVLIRKELRLIARDPWLLTQLLSQFVFLVPMTLLLWRRGPSSGMPWAWLMVIFVSGSIASALAWLTVSGEDVPELLASSPLATATLVRAKLDAALLPVVPLLLAPLVALLGTRPVFALSLAVCAAGASVSCALLQIRNPVARKRADFRTRHKGQGLNGLIEVTVIALWVGLCAIVTVLI